MHDLLNEQIPSDDGDELADHDFDNVSQTGCNYEDNGKGLQLDVEKILGSGTEEVSKLILLWPFLADSFIQNSSCIVFWSKLEPKSLEPNLQSKI